MTIRRFIAVAVVAFAPGVARAAPLPPEQCTQLAAELTALDKAGIKTVLEKGPAASKGSLTREQREQVRAYLDKLGQMRFRCSNEAPVVTLRAEPPEDPREASATSAPIEAGSPGITLPPGVAAVGGVSAAPKKAAPPKKDAKAPPQSEPGQPTPVTKPQPSPAAKAPPVTPKAAPSSEAQPATPKASAQPKAQPKAKVDDALRPPQPPAQPVPK